MARDRMSAAAGEEVEERADELAFMRAQARAQLDAAQKFGGATVIAFREARKLLAEAPEQNGQIHLPF